jgi:putative ABC transport system ATP-binding protein
VSATELRATSLGVDVDGRTLFSDVNFTVSAGQMLVITGASGSGKTTLAHVLAGVIEPDRGGVTFSDVPIGLLGRTNDRPALVPQDFGLVSVLTVAETVSLPLQVHSVGQEEIRERAAKWLGALGLEICADRTVAELSGGQRQRVAIARALVIGADVIVMDEPTAELDPDNRALILSLIEDELSRGAVLVIVSHETDVIARADSVYGLAMLR